MKIRIVIITLLGIISGLCADGWQAHAVFHSGGVGSCGGCHVMHGTTGKLHGSDPSSTCLICHASSLKVLTPDGSAYTPGGDFFWLSRSYVDAVVQSPGYTHGHNVIAVDFGLVPDPVRSSGPSRGAVQYQSGWLGCHSCHDPHGRISGPSPQAALTRSGSYGNDPSGGNYRLLGGVGYRGGSEAIGISFSAPSPVAKALSPVQGEWPAETDAAHVDYGSGLSEWCANCHSGYDTLDHGAAFSHPAGSAGMLGSDEILQYNAYLATGDMGGLSATAYDRLVPFERGTIDRSTLNPNSTEGPSLSAAVMCLTCHRAHATPFSNAGRWDFQVQNLVDSPVLQSPEAIHAYYGDDITTRYNAGQGQLCEKCHAASPP